MLDYIVIDRLTKAAFYCNGIRVEIRDQKGENESLLSLCVILSLLYKLKQNTKPNLFVHARWVITNLRVCFP